MFCFNFKLFNGQYLENIDVSNYTVPTNLKDELVKDVEFIGITDKTIDKETLKKFNYNVGGVGFNEYNDEYFDELSALLLETADFETVVKSLEVISSFVLESLKNNRSISMDEIVYTAHTFRDGYNLTVDNIISACNYLKNHDIIISDTFSDKDEMIEDICFDQYSIDEYFLAYLDKDKFSDLFFKSNENKNNYRYFEYNGTYNYIKDY